jgi:hypothetical protein
MLEEIGWQDAQNAAHVSLAKKKWTMIGTTSIDCISRVTGQPFKVTLLTQNGFPHLPQNFVFGLFTL